jgi:hypothetical protein
MELDDELTVSRRRHGVARKGLRSWLRGEWAYGALIVGIAAFALFVALLFGRGLWSWMQLDLPVARSRAGLHPAVAGLILAAVVVVLFRKCVSGQEEADSECVVPPVLEGAYAWTRPFSPGVAQPRFPPPFRCSAQARAAVATHPGHGARLGGRRPGSAHARVG